MTRWICIATLLALMESSAIAEAAKPRPISCKVKRGSRKMRVESFEMVSSSFKQPKRRCRELGRAMRRTLAKLAPSRGRVEYHVWLADVSTAKTIRFEARAWAVSKKGRHLRHITRATAVAKQPSQPRRHEKVAPRVARTAIDRALRDLVSELRTSEMIATRD